MMFSGAVLLVTTHATKFMWRMNHFAFIAGFPFNKKRLLIRKALEPHVEPNADMNE